MKKYFQHGYVQTRIFYERTEGRVADLNRTYLVFEKSSSATEDESHEHTPEEEAITQYHYNSHSSLSA